MGKKKGDRRKKRRPAVGDWVIENKDCVLGMRHLRDAAIEPRLIFADPPFNLGFGYDKYDDNEDLDTYYGWCREWIGDVYDTIHSHGTFWLAICDEHVSELDVMAKQCGFHKRSHVVWYYTFGVACAKNFARSHTHLLYYTKRKTRHTWTGGGRVPSARQLVYNDKRANPAGKFPDNTWVLSPKDTEKAFAYTDEKKLDTWLASRVCGTFGERVAGALNQMPLEIMRRVVETTSNPGDLVMDPFGGTFSTGVAAISLGRNFHGFDVSKAYCKRGRARLRQEAARLSTNL